MSLWFLLPTVTCVIATLLSSRWKDEPSLICAGLAILSFPVALILAPWEVQVLLLLSIVLVARYGIRSNESLAESAAPDLTGPADQATIDQPSRVMAWGSRLKWPEFRPNDQERPPAKSVAVPTRSADSTVAATSDHLATASDRIYRGVTWHQSDLSPESTLKLPETIELKYRGTTVKRKL